MSQRISDADCPSPPLAGVFSPGERAVVSGDIKFFERLSELSRGRVVVRSAEQNSYAELIEFVDRILFDDPTRAVVLHFPSHKSHDYRRAAALATSTWHAETAIRAVVARDDLKNELVVTIHGEHIAVGERTD